METKTISRRIDENGCLTLPDEFKKALNITNGTRLDITIIDDTSIMVTKSKDMENITDYLTKIAFSLSETIEHDCLITNLDKVIASNKKKCMQKPITPMCQELIYKKEVTIKKADSDSQMVEIVPEFNKECLCELIVPILVETEVLGSIIVLAETCDPNFESSIKPCVAFAKYIASKII